MLSLLCAHANDVLQRELALKTIWIDDNYFNARSMDVYITKLRKASEDDPSIEDQQRPWKRLSSDYPHNRRGVEQIA